MFRIKIASLALTSVSLVALAASAAAQEAPAKPTSSSDKADVIIVTAQKREENIIDVPESISVANQAQLERQQVNTLVDLSRVAPSLELSNAPGNSPGGGGQIRGIGTQSFQQGAVGSVGIVVDGVSQGNVNISDLFDIGRVEVLKGPQGTLFGLTTSAGVINITTNAPEFDKFSARLRTELSNHGTAGSQFGQQIVQGLVNIPIADNAGLRISANLNERQGVDRNTLTGDYTDHETYGARGRFLWEPTDKLTINLIADYTKSSDDDQDFFTVKAANATTQGILAACGITASDGNRDVCTTTPGYANSKTYGGSGQIDFDAGPFTLTSITAGRKQDSGPNLLNIFRIDTNPQAIIQGPASGETNLVSQEFRIASPTGAKLEYTAGLFYSNQNTNNPAGPFNIFIQIPVFPFTINPVSAQGNNVSIGDFSKAVFGQLTYHVTDKFRLLAGARYTEETLKVTSATKANTGTSSARTDIDNTSWRVGAQYEFTPNLMSYATASRGYKGPQIAIADPSNPFAVNTIIRPEIPTDYEVGLKQTSFGGRLITDANIFDIKLKDYQGQVCTVNPSTSALNCVPQNVNGVVSKGAEVNVFGRPLEDLTLNTGLIWNSAHYPDGFLGSDNSDLTNEQLSNAPEWKFTFSGEYKHQFTSGLEGFVAADTVYKSDTKYAASTDPNLTFDAHWILGGRIGIRSPDGRWSAALFGRNLTNEHEPIILISGLPGEPPPLSQAGNYGQLLTTQSFRLVGISLDGKF